MCSAASQPHDMDQIQWQIMEYGAKNINLHYTTDIKQIKQKFCLQKVTSFIRNEQSLQGIYLYNIEW